MIPAFVFQPESSRSWLRISLWLPRAPPHGNYPGTPPAEYMDIIATYPSVVYEVVKTNGEHIEVDNPANLPDMSVVEEIREPS